MIVFIVPQLHVARPILSRYRKPDCNKMNLINYPSSMSAALGVVFACASMEADA